jgi:hypothetical protein
MHRLQAGLTQHGLTQRALAKAGPDLAWPVPMWADPAIGMSTEPTTRRAIDPSTMITTRLAGVSAARRMRNNDYSSAAYRD